MNNVPGGIRTPNLLIRSQKLYPVELQALKENETIEKVIRPMKTTAPTCHQVRNQSRKI